jgi:hypothetical protein
MTHIEQLHLDAITSEVYIIHKYGQDQIADADKAAAKSAEITDNIACEFAEFISNHRLDFQPSTLGRFIGLDMKSYTAKELFQEYLKTKENDKSK